MSGQVAIQRLKPYVYRVRFRVKGTLHELYYADAREACEAAAGILLGRIAR